MQEALLLPALFLSAYLGFALLALGQARQWRRVSGAPPPDRIRILALRLLGAAGLALSLTLSLLRDGPSFGSLLWTTTISLAALAIACPLTWRPGLMRPLTRLALPRRVAPSPVDR